MLGKEVKVRVEEKLRAKGYELWPMGKPLAKYSWFRQSGRYLYLAGHGPFVGKDNVQKYKGKIGREYTVEQGKEIGLTAVLSCLSSIKEAVGDLDRVKGILQLMAYVNCAGEVEGYFHVADGACDLLFELFGDYPARLAIGVSQTPLDVPICMTMVVEVDEKAVAG